MFLKQLFANVLVLGTLDFQGNTITLIVLRHKHYCLYCSPLNFLTRASSKIISNYFKLFWMKAVTGKWKQIKTHLLRFQLFIPYKPAFFTGEVSRMTTIRLGIFHGQALWADSVSPWMNTIASHDQFKPIRV